MHLRPSLCTLIRRPCHLASPTPTTPRVRRAFDLSYNGEAVSIVASHGQRYSALPPLSAVYLFVNSLDDPNASQLCNRLDDADDTGRLSNSMHTSKRGTLSTAASQTELSYSGCMALWLARVGSHVNASKTLSHRGRRGRRPASHFRAWGCWKFPRRNILSKQTNSLRSCGNPS